MWSETIAGRSREWTDEQLETAGVLALVYGKVIHLLSWRMHNAHDIVVYRRVAPKRVCSPDNTVDKHTSF
jgi:hypothetical protein